MITVIVSRLRDVRPYAVVAGICLLAGLIIGVIITLKLTPPSIEVRRR